MASRPKQPTPRQAPRLYLITPPVADASAVTDQLASAMDAGDIAAVLLKLAEADERTLINCTKKLAPIIQDKGAALLLDGHVELVARAGADGAHLRDLAAFTEAFHQLKPDRIAGVGGLTTRHDAMVAAERGADYVMFGEPGPGGSAPAFGAVEERVAWWAELFEIPCVGYAASLENIEPLVTAGADFVAVGDFVWRDPQTLAMTIREATRFLQLPEPAA